MKNLFTKLLALPLILSLIILLSPAISADAACNSQIGGEKYSMSVSSLAGIYYLKSDGTLIKNKQGEEEVVATNVKDYISNGNYGAYVLSKDGRLYLASYYYWEIEGMTPEKQIDTGVKSLVKGDYAGTYNGLLAIKNDNSLWQYEANLKDFTKIPARQIMTDVVTVAIDHNGSTNYDANSFPILAIRTDGNLWGMGGNTTGELGLGHTNPVPYGSPVKIMDNVKDVAVCDHSSSGSIDVNDVNSYALTNNNELYSWGATVKGALHREGTNLLPGKVVDNVKKFTVNYNISGPKVAYLTLNGDLYSFGIDSTCPDFDEYHKLRKIDSGVKDMVSAAHSIYYLKNDNSLWCDGFFYSEAYPESHSREEKPAKVMDNVISFYVGTFLNLAVDESGMLWAWGRDNFHNTTNNTAYTPEDENRGMGPVQIKKVFNPLPPASPEGTIYRLYDPTNGDHIYTVSLEERNQLLSAGWNLEKSPGMTAGKDGVKIYRLTDNKSHEHLFTASKKEVDKLSKEGWTVDNGGNPVFYGAKSGKAVYRLFNPGAKSAIDSHHYTLEKNEIRVLTTERGWLADNNGKPVFYLN